MPDLCPPYQLNERNGKPSLPSGQIITRQAAKQRSPRPFRAGRRQMSTKPVNAAQHGVGIQFVRTRIAALQRIDARIPQAALLASASFAFSRLT